MKYKSTILKIMFVLWLLPVSSAVSQSQASMITKLDVDIWPDYDRPSVLVLLTGTLSENSTLPASITLPLPETARLNAVARIDPKDGRMKDDIPFKQDPPGMLTFTTPDLRFRVEYYFPYKVNEKQHAFEYTWVAPIGVGVFRLSVQQPLSAESFTAEPPIASITHGRDGLAYHTFPSQPVEAWQPVSLKVAYTMAGIQLSKKSAPTPNPSPQATLSPPQSQNDFRVNWALIAMVLGGLIIIGALIRQFAFRRSSSPRSKSAELENKRGLRVKFCPHCGERIVRKGKFCSECGREL